ncbi:hypothetical protein HDV01_002639 [Terramyces sp. JEL0728]|nr:hypothetical protein HDV01_002639 [Terramyces sp. JEL0728]
MENENSDRIVGRISTVLDSNDPIARALTFSVLGFLSNYSNNEQLQFRILSALDNSQLDEIELFAILETACRLAVKNADFASDFYQILLTSHSKTNIDHILQLYKSISIISVRCGQELIEKFKVAVNEAITSEPGYCIPLLKLAYLVCPEGASVEKWANQLLLPNRKISCKGIWILFPLLKSTTIIQECVRMLLTSPKSFVLLEKVLKFRLPRYSQNVSLIVNSKDVQVQFKILFDRYVFPASLTKDNIDFSEIAHQYNYWELYKLCRLQICKGNFHNASQLLADLFNATNSIEFSCWIAALEKVVEFELSINSLAEIEEQMKAVSSITGGCAFQMDFLNLQSKLIRLLQILPAKNHQAAIGRLLSNLSGEFTKLAYRYFDIEQHSQNILLHYAFLCNSLYLLTLSSIVEIDHERSNSGWLYSKKLEIANLLINQKDTGKNDLQSSLISIYKSNRLIPPYFFQQQSRFSMDIDTTPKIITNIPLRISKLCNFVFEIDGNIKNESSIKRKITKLDFKVTSGNEILCESKWEFSSTSRINAEVEVFINDKPVKIEAGSAVIQACEKAGVDIPRFCYHERLGIAGNCRMCLVEVGGPKPVASCAMPVMPGMKVQTETPNVKKAREGVMEFLLANHPLDCPICDQGGECDLQDQSIRYGADRSRFKEVVGKRATENKDLGPLVKTVMTRCIHCTRCVRFANEIAGASELGTTGRGNSMEIGTYVSKAIKSEMSGNLVDLCPVGALTSKPYAFTTRPWELKRTESIDVMDGIGSNIKVDTRGNEVMRIVPRLNDDINEEWISDKSRFVSDGLKNQRLTSPLVKKGNDFVPVSWADALQTVANALKETDPEHIAAVAGQLSDAESLVALKDLINKFNSDNLYTESNLEVAGGLTDIRSNYVLNSSIAGIEEADALLLIGSNPRHEGPILNTRIRKSYLHNGLQIGVVGEKGDLNYDAEHVSADASGLDKLLSGEHKFSKTLSSAKKPLLLLGQSTLDDPAVLKKASELALKLSKSASSEWTSIFNVLQKDASSTAAFDVGYSTQAPKANTKFLYLLGADDIDPSNIPKDAFVVYQGHHGDVGAYYADVILPGSAYTEKSATYVNTEGRVQTTRSAIPPPAGAREDWKIVRALSEVAGKKLPYDEVHQLRSRMVQVSPTFAGFDEFEKTSSPVVQLGLSHIKAYTATTTQPLQLAFKDFYMTNSIARSSSTMAKCSQDGFEAEQLKDYLNEKFADIVRPNFLGPVSVSKFDFGSIPPQISVTNICEPLDEFYYLDDDNSEELQSELEDGSFNSNFSSYYNNSEDDTMIPRKETDAQVEISIAYQGDMTMSITTELIVNQPTPGFMILPLTLTLTKTSLKGAEY